MVWSAANSAQANANFARHLGIGTGVYWFMGGPGVDPHYDGTAREANAPPAGWCLTGSVSSVCAQFFGGVIRGSKHALMWQWSGGGGSRNGVGDFDQIDASRTP